MDRDLGCGTGHCQGQCLENGRIALPSVPVNPDSWSLLWGGRREEGESKGHQVHIFQMAYAPWAHVYISNVKKVRVPTTWDYWEIK